MDNDTDPTNTGTVAVLAYAGSILGGFGFASVSAHNCVIKNLRRNTEELNFTLEQATECQIAQPRRRML